MIVAPYPHDLPLYDQHLPPAERKRIRALLLDLYNAALRIFDPRHHVPDEYPDRHE